MAPVVDGKKGGFPWVWVLGGCGCLLVFGCVILGAILFPVFTRARYSARKSMCASNMRRVGVAMMMYVNDHNDKLPPAANWVDAMTPYTKNAAVLKCPETSGWGYAYNADYGGKKTADFQRPDTAVLVIETSAQRKSATVTTASIATSRGHRHNGGDNVVYADGHVRWVPGSVTP